MMPLTAYTAHVIAIWLIQDPDGNYPAGWLILAAFTVAAMAIAVTWLHFFRSGPLERISGPHRTPPGSWPPRDGRPAEPFTSRRSGTRSAPPARPGVRDDRPPGSQLELASMAHRAAP